jgi:8-oxo-dGTP pyrophosphatase MutT (NUDIX family)
VRPIGGAIEFGERAANALQREFMEELGEVITAPKLITVIESLFEHHGARARYRVRVRDRVCKPGRRAHRDLPIFATAMWNARHVGSTLSISVQGVSAGFPKA